MNRKNRGFHVQLFGDVNPDVATEYAPDMVTIDLRRDLGHLYHAVAQRVDFVEVPPLYFLMIDGQGSPSSLAFQDAIQALYSVAYTAKFELKKSGTHFPVMPLEGLWSSDPVGFDGTRPQSWLWTLMILQPDVVTAQIFERVREALLEKKRLPALDSMRLERFEEGTSAQTLHIGPYSSEQHTLDFLFREIARAGFKPRGMHHEIYLGDPRRSAPDRLKTILRIPISRQPS